MQRSQPSVLCIAPSWLGDAIMALPALRQLRDARATIDLLTRGATTRVLIDSIGAGTVHESVGGSRLRRFAEARALRRHRFDAAIVLAPSWSSAAVAWMSGARERVGERGDGRRLWLTHALTRAGRSMHLALAYQRIVRAALTRLGSACDNAHSITASRPSSDAIGGDAPPGLYAYPTLTAYPDESATASGILAAQALPPDTRPLIVAPGARYGAAKRYPVDRFVAAARQVSERLQTPVVVVGSVQDTEPAQQFVGQLPGAINLAGKTDLGTLIGLLARARGVLSNDSGVMHLSAALGVPVVGVFGSTNPLWTRPLGPRAGWVSHPVPCAPCYRRTCPIDFPCMLGLEPQTLVQRLLALIQPDADRTASASTPV